VRQHFIRRLAGGEDELVEQIVRAIAERDLREVDAVARGERPAQREPARIGRYRCSCAIAAGNAASAFGDGPSGFSFEATLIAPEIPSSRSSSSIGLPGWYTSRSRT
jgi:hypothetical protein